MAADALLLVSFGGPEGPDEVMPFLERVTAGRGVPRERLEVVAEHYLAMGGVSPINDQNRALLAALRDELAARSIDLPLYWGNRNSAPLLPDVLAEIHADGHREILAVTTSAYPSYSGCRQYRENLASALDESGLGETLSVATTGPYFDQAGFLEPFAETVSAAVARARESGLAASDLEIMFTTHSIPIAMDRNAGPDEGRPEEGPGRYVLAHLEAARAVMTRLDDPADWRLVYQSRSGPPQVPWLEPDVNDALRESAERGRRQVLLVPIGFISDHMEVLWDLDNEARATADELGLELVRLPTPGVHAAFVGLLADLLASAVPWVGGPAVGYCSSTCCRNAREDRPVVPGSARRA